MAVKHFLIGGSIILVVLYMRSFYLVHHSQYGSKESFDHMDLILLQNETIHLLQQKLHALSERYHHIDPHPDNSMVTNAPKESLPSVIIKYVDRFIQQPASSSHQQSALPLVPKQQPQQVISDIPYNLLHDYQTEIEQSCEARFGLPLVSQWRSNAQTWCDEPPSATSSKLVCYPMHQNHKKISGQSSDLFCVATNFVIDFSKVHGTASNGHKPSLGSQYYSFDDGSLSASCQKTKEYKDHLFMPHMNLQFREFHDNIKNPSFDSIERVPTYLLARDEDCENAFHSTADFMNMFLVQNVLQYHPRDQQVLLFDKHPTGPYLELIQKAYAPQYGVHRGYEKYGSKKVKFDKLVFHLESPAGLIFPKVSRPDQMRCWRTSLFDAYRRFILRSFDLLHVAPPPIPTITMILRKRTAHKNVGRVLANEAEVTQVLASGNMMRYHVVDPATMTLGEQFKLIRSSNILIGIHGAGLMFIMFAADEAVLIEVHPSYRQDRHFRHASRLSGKYYMPMRSTNRETCVGSSDNIVIPIDEFTRTVDGAVRLARSFDNGISECGLHCNKGILALDHRLDPYYTQSDRKASPINTQFPCG